jgi:hypothetical protein
MTSKVDALRNRLATEGDSHDFDGLSPLAQLLAREIPELLKLARNLGREASAQTEYLMKTSTAVATDKGLINAAVQTSDACEMFFMLLDLFRHDDPDIKFKVMAACGQMRQGLANIIVNLRAKGGSPEITRRIEEISEIVFAKIEVIRDMTKGLIEEDTAKAVDPGKKAAGFNLIIQKRNAAEVVNRRQKELREAEEDVKKLNRAMARRT